MTINVANTTLTNTFEYLVNRTTELSDAMSTRVITTDSNTTPGNATITGTFSANVYIVGNSASNTSISAPNTEQKSSGNYFLNANGSWTSIVANNGIIANSSGIFVNANTGIVANASGVFVNSNYIGTVTSNNATNLGGVAAASYVQNTDSRTLSGNLVFSGANVSFTGANVKFTGASLSDVTVVSGTWSGSIIALDKGGTGSNTQSGARTALGLGTMATQSASGVAITGGSITGITELTVDGGIGGTIVATQAIAETGTNNTVVMTPLRTKQAITQNITTKANIASPTFTGTVSISSLDLGSTTVTDVATQAQAEAGSVNSVVMTPLRTAQAIASFRDYVSNTFTSSGTWTKPAGAPASAIVIVEAWGGGGGGGRISGLAGGGGGGGYMTETFTAGKLTATVAVTVGGGGAGRTGSTGNGTAGGSSTFGSYVTAYGGGGGGQNGNGNGGGGGGELEAGDTGGAGGILGGGSYDGGDALTIYGGGGGGSEGTKRTGGNAVYGGGGGGVYGNSGGRSLFAGAGGFNGSGGSVPAGGGGTAINTNGGNGARGEIRVLTVW